MGILDMNPPLTLTYKTFFSLLEGLYNNGRAQLQLPPRGLLTLAKTLEKKEEEYNSTQIFIIFYFHKYKKFNFKCSLHLFYKFSFLLQGKHHIHFIRGLWDYQEEESSPSSLKFSPSAWLFLYI
jgi:hypothetical protein